MEKQEPNEITNLIDTRSDDEKIQAAIKKYSRQTKTYPKTEWWDWDRD